MAAERSAVLLDWGGVMTGDLFGSFRAFCAERGPRPRRPGQPLPPRPRRPRAAHRLRVRAHRGGRLRAPARHRARPRLARGAHRPPLRRRRPGRRDGRRRARAARRAASRTGLVSNSWGTRRYPRDLLAELFDGIVISGEEGFRKPDPRMYELGAQRIGADAEPHACSSTTSPSTSTPRASSGWPWCTTRRRPRRWRSSSGCWVVGRVRRRGVRRCAALTASPRARQSPGRARRGPRRQARKRWSIVSGQRAVTHHAVRREWQSLAAAGRPPPAAPPRDSFPSVMQ